MLEPFTTKASVLLQKPVQFDGQVVKINRRNDPQERQLVITGSHLYNLKGDSVQRAIQVEDIEGVVMSKCSYQFVLRVRGGYDYRFQTPQRWRVYESVIKLLAAKGSHRLPLYLVDSDKLHGYCRNPQGAGKESLPLPIDFEFDSSLNRIISNLLQADHRVLYIADPHLFEIHPTELVEVLKLGRFTALVEHQRSKDKMVRKIISKDGLGGSSCSLRRSFVEYQQSSQTESVVFVLENPDNFMVYCKAYKHSLADDLMNFREFDEVEIKCIFSQVLTAVMILQLQEVSLEKVVYDELDRLVLTEFEQLKAKNVVLGKQEISPEEFSTKKKSPTTVMWRLGVFLFKLVYGIGPQLYQPDKFFSERKLMFDEDRRSRISTNLDLLIQQLLEFDCLKRMRHYSIGAHCQPSDIIRHGWFSA